MADSDQTRSANDTGQSDAPADAKRAPKIRRKWLRRALWGVGICLFLGLVAVLLAPSLISSGWVRRRLACEATKAIGQPVRIGEIAFSWGGRFALRDLAVDAASGDTEERLLHVGLVRARWAWRPLLSGRVALDECLVEGVRVRVVRCADGSMNLPVPPSGVESKTAAPSPPPSVSRSIPTELPIDRLHVALRDWRVEYVDRSLNFPPDSDRALRGGVALRSLSVDLDGARQPLNVACDGALEIGDGPSSTPLVFSLSWKPGPGGHLDWRGAQQEARGESVGLRGRLDAGPTPGVAGIRAQGMLQVRPGEIERFATRALEMGPPASASGEVNVSLDAEWRDGASPRVRMRMESNKLAVSPPRLGGKRVDCDALFTMAATGPATALGTMPEANGWTARPVLRVDVPSLTMAGSGDIRTVAPKGAPRVSGRLALAHRPSELRPYLEALGVPLPPDADRVRRVNYAAELSGDLVSSVTLSGRLDVEANPPTWRELQGLDAVFSPVLRLGVRHELRYEVQEDRAGANVAVSLSDSVDIPGPFLSLDAVAAPLSSDTQHVESEIAFRVEPLVAPLVRSGVIPHAARTSGTLRLHAAVERERDGAVHGDALLRGRLGAALLAVEGLAPSELARALRPVSLDILEVKMAADVDPGGGEMRFRQSGAARLDAGWRGPVGMDAPLDARLALPVTWEGNGSVAGDGFATADMTMRLEPDVSLAGPLTLDHSDRIQIAAGVDLSSDGADVEVRDARFAIGDWLRVAASAQARDGARQSLRSQCEVSLEWGDALLAWVPAEWTALAGGVDAAGRTQLNMRADGRYAPDSPESLLRVGATLAHRLDRLVVGGQAEPLGVLEAFRADLATSLTLRGDGTILAPSGSLQVHGNRVEALGLVAARGLRFEGAFDGDPTQGRVGWDVECRVSEVAASGELPLRLGPVELSTRGDADVPAGPVSLEEIALRVGAPGQSEPLALVDASCRLTSPTGPFQLRADVSLPALEGLSQWLESVANASARPTSLTLVARELSARIRDALSQLPQVQGAVGLRLEGEGNVPTMADIQARRLPLRMDCAVQFRDVATTRTASPSATVRGLRNDLALAIDGSGVGFQMQGALLEASSDAVPGLRLGPTDWEGRLDIDAKEASASWENWTVRVPDWGLTLRLDGRSEGWDRLGVASRDGDLPPALANMADALGFGDTTAVSPYASAARAIGFRNHARLDWERAEWLTLPALGARVQGRARFAMQLLQEPGREVRTDLSAEFTDLSVEMAENVAVRDVDGALRMLIAGRTRPGRRPAPGYASRLVLPFGDEFESGPAGEPVRILAPPRPEQSSNLRIGEVVARPWILRDIRVGSRGDLRDWLLEIACADLMGGRAEARVRLRESDIRREESDWEISVEGGFTGVSARSAIQAWRRLPARETELNGVFQFRWRVDRAAETPVELLRGIEMRLTVTSIGKRALEGFLMALDPEGRNPSFVSGRQALRYGRPESVRFVLRHGLIDMKVRLTTVARSWDMTLLDRAPVGEATSLEALRPQLEALHWMRVALDMLSGLDQWAAGPNLANTRGAAAKIADRTTP